MRRFFFGSKPVEPDKNEDNSGTFSSKIDENFSADSETLTSKPDASTQTLNIANIQNDEDLKKALNEYTEEDWKNFAKDHPQIVKIITDVSNENEKINSTESAAKKDSQNDIDCLVVESDSRSSISSIPRQLVTNFIEKSLALISRIYQKIQNKFTQENLKLIEEVLTEILHSFAYQENPNRENSVAIAFVLRGLTEAQSLPTIREIPNIGVYITVLTILIEMLKVFMHITFSPDKQELRNKISKLFD